MTDGPANQYRLHGLPAHPDQEFETVTRSLPAFEDGAERPDIRHFLTHTILGPPHAEASKNWAFMSTGKNGSSSTLRYLYELEFGHPPTAHFNSPHDINPSALIHVLADHGVFRRAIAARMSVPDLQNNIPHRLMVVRNPISRAVSGFRYFCQSDRSGASWFLHERVRIDAAVGFDWRTMPDTVEGFRRFLHFIEQEIALLGANKIDNHWRPQAVSSRPDIFRPTLTGRMEEMPAFFAELAKRLGKPAAATIPHENRQPPTPDDLQQDPEARHLIRRIYAADFEAFGY